MTIYCDYNRNLVYLYLGHGRSVTNLKKALLKTGSSIGKMSLYICITKPHSRNSYKEKDYLIYRVNLFYSHPGALFLPFIWITIFYFPTIFVCLFWIAILPLCIDLLALGCFVCWFVCLPGKEGLSPRGFVSSPRGCHCRGLKPLLWHQHLGG